MIVKEKQKEDAKKLCQLILRKRRLDKDIETYYQRVLDNLYIDDIIRGYYHHISTKTARLTSDQQQIPKGNISNVKRMYITRYKD